MNIIQGNLIGKDEKVAIVASRFNEFIVSKLIDGANDGLTRHGIDPENIDLIWVPGAFEIPLLAKTLANTQKYDAILCLGAVIRGATPHFDYVCAEVSKGIAQVSLETNLPVLFGVLTTENINQAIERSGTKSGNKGYDVALSAIELINLQKKLTQ